MPWKNKRMGRCKLCGARGLVEGHHVSYRPERKIDLCHSCHFSVHYKPWLLKENQIFVLLNEKMRGTEAHSFLKSQESIKKKVQEYAHTLTLLAQKRQPIPDVAPSRQEHGWTPREAKLRSETRESIERNYNLRIRERASGGGETERERE